MSQTGAFELLGPRLGLGPKSRQSYINLDMGDRQPTEAEAKVLADWLGGYPVEGSVGTEDAPADLAAAIRDLTDELAAIRAERQAWSRGVLEVIRAFDGGQVPEALLNALAPRTHEDARR